MKKLIRTFAHRLGYSINRIPRVEATGNGYSPLSDSHRVVDLERLAAFGLTVPGMITAESGKLLYTMCVLQGVRGSVVEIGSWQGRSTSFLARAVRESGNGPFYAIDHFRGNVGKERFYRVDAANLSDLRSNFERNMRRLGLWNELELLDMPNSEAAARISGPIRFLFIDGDHTRAGVEKDIELFFEKLAPGALVVFDDYELNSSGVVGAVNDLMARVPTSRRLTYQKTLVLEV